MPPLSAAIGIATKAHQGQKRADGADFIEHPLAVAHILMEASTHLATEVYLVAVLHDVLEDTSVTYRELAEKLGRDTAAATAALTRIPGQDERAYLEQIRRASNVYPFLPLIKAADRIHNVATRRALEPGKSRSMLRETQRLYLPWFREMLQKSPPDLQPPFGSLLARLRGLIISQQW